ncbi:MAG TPA: DUF4388 domain-containing protein [Polyangia bacterium]|nr:DUF4388 domain-containing protein [Polyangia bacterium]
MSVAPPDVIGFRAHLRGASLWDLVQMECLARTRGVFQVTGEGGVGYLYMSDGHVVHAVTRRLDGEAAALEILGWTNGSFQACDRIWPPRPTIDVAYEKLLLQVAKRRDEAQFSSNLVAFPGGASATAVAVSGAVTSVGDQFEILEIADETGGDEEEPGTMRSTGGMQTSGPAEPPGRGDPTAPFPVVIRLGPGGVVVSSKGASDDQAEAVAYAHRLAQLAGELLGLDPFTAMECTFAQGRCLIYADANGDVVAVRPPADGSLQPLRDKVGL